MTYLYRFNYISATRVLSFTSTSITTRMLWPTFTGFTLMCYTCVKSYIYRCNCTSGVTCLCRHNYNSVITYIYRCNYLSSRAYLYKYHFKNVVDYFHRRIYTSDMAYLYRHKYTSLWLTSTSVTSQMLWPTSTGVTTWVWGLTSTSVASQMLWPTSTGVTTESCYLPLQA